MIQSPVLIIGCPRSGTTLLYQILAESPELWSIGYESKAIIERYHHPAVKGWESGALLAEDLTAESRSYIRQAFVEQSAPGTYWQKISGIRGLINRIPIYAAVKRRGRSAAVGASVSSGVPGGGLAVFRALARWRNRLAPPPGPIRLLEKTPENCLRLPFLRTLFPDARVIFLTRDARANVHSLLEGWRQPHLFPGYQTPLPVTSPGQTRGRWAFTLIPGWRALVDRPLVEICARQWVACNQAVLDFAASPDKLPILRITYEQLSAQPAESLGRIADFLDLDLARIPAAARPLPEVNVVSSPGKEKWRAESAALASVEPIIAPLMAQLYGGEI